MRTDLDHLPLRKQQELQYILQVLFEEFENHLRGATSAKKKSGRILNVVLYGSHARGGWVSNPARGYFSDYDILVVVNQDQLAEPGGWVRLADDRFVREQIMGKIKAPVSLIVHTLNDINNHLALGRYFFGDIVKEGISLYEATGGRLKDPTPPNPSEAHGEAKRYFAEWQPLAQTMLKLARTSMHEAEALAGVRDSAKASERTAHQRNAAFLFHQTVERAYNCLLLVHSQYSPPTHSIRYLRSQSELRDPSLCAAWPSDTRQDQSRFNKLKEAYVKARYAKHFPVTNEELAWYSERIEVLLGLAEASCQARLKEMAAEARRFKAKGKADAAATPATDS